MGLDMIDSRLAIELGVIIASSAGSFAVIRARAESARERSEEAIRSAEAAHKRHDRQGERNAEWERRIVAVETKLEVLPEIKMSMITLNSKLDSLLVSVAKLQGREER